MALSPSRAKAISELKVAESRCRKRPNVNSLQSAARKLRQRCEILKLSHLDRECQKFFADIERTHPQKRASLMYRYIKRHRNKANSRNNNNITIQNWDDELKLYCNGSRVRSIPEADHCPVEPPPDVSDIAAIVSKMNNGTAAGQDRLNIELIKSGPPELIEAIHMVIVKAWSSNLIPASWLNSTQVPIPKIRSPKSVGDFRRLAITNTIYKIYAYLLLLRLQDKIEPLPCYQAGFLPNRSTDDHIFVLRRLAEERWRKGLPTYITSIDLKKAFDLVDIQQVGPILTHYGVPAFLVNRIIAAILQERTSILWSSRRTNTYSKNRGIKQGCPISPYIFVLVMNHAILRACTRLGIDPDMQSFQLPIILAYADDIILVTNNLSACTSIFRALEEELKLIGLSINENKCSILLRDPSGIELPLQPTVDINGHNIPSVPTMRYLGIYIAS